MAVPQGQVQQRTDLTSYLIGNINTAKANRADAANQAFRNILGAGELAFNVGKTVDQDIQQDNDRIFQGNIAELQSIGTNPQTGQFDQKWLDAQALVNPDVANLIRRTHRYQTTGKFELPQGNVAPLGDVINHLLQTGELTTNYGQIKGTSPGGTDQFFSSVDPNWQNNPLLMKWRSTFGDTMDQSDRLIADRLLKNARDPETMGYFALLTQGGEVSRMPGQESQAPGAEGMPGVTTELAKGVSDTTQAIPGTQSQGPATAGQQAVSSAQGMALSRQAGAQALSNVQSGTSSPEKEATAIAGRAGLGPGLTPEKLQQLQGTPAMQAAYAAVPKGFEQLFGVSAQAFQPIADISEGMLSQVLSVSGENQTKLLGEMANRIKTALPQAFKNVSDPRQVVQQYLTLRSQIASSSLSNAIQNGGVGANGQVANAQSFTIPIDPETKSPVLYMPSTNLQGAQTTPSVPEQQPTELPNKVATIGEATPVMAQAPPRPNNQFETVFNDAVKVGTNEISLSDAYLKQATGQQLSPDEKSAIQGNTRIGRVAVRLNGDAQVGGFKLSELVQNLPTRTEDISRMLLKFNGMGISDEDLADPFNTTIDNYMALATPAGKKFLEQNEIAKSTLAGIIDIKQLENQTVGTQTSMYNAQTSRGELQESIRYHNALLQMQNLELAAKTGGGSTDGTGQRPKTYAELNAAMNAYANLFSKIEQVKKGRTPEWIAEWERSPDGKQMMQALDLAWQNAQPNQPQVAIPKDATTPGTTTNLMTRGALSTWFNQLSPESLTAGQQRPSTTTTTTQTQQASRPVQSTAQQNPTINRILSETRR